MVRNYLLVAVRNIFRHKLISLISVTGLAVGIACCSLVLLFLTEEMSFDQHHADHERIVRIVQDIQNQSSTRSMASVAFPVAAALEENFSEVEAAGRILRLSPGLVTYGDKQFYENQRCCADNEILKIFSLPFLAGNPDNALERPKTVVISRMIADKYFGNENPVGKTIRLNTTDYEVTGVVENARSNTHWKYDIIISMPTLNKYPDMLANWFGNETYTYAKLIPSVDIASFGARVRNLADSYVGEELSSRGTVYQYHLQPVADIHLYSNLQNEMAAPGNRTTLALFAIVGTLVLLIACMNFVNLATARSFGRAREVGLRKVVGAQRRQLIGQFLCESVLLASIALMAALLIIELARPLFNDLTGMQLDRQALMAPGALAILALTTLVAGLIGGSYPAFVLSSFRPIFNLKSIGGAPTRGSVLRKAMVVFQFAASVVLIICTAFVVQQIDFMKNQPLGFDKEQKIVIPFDSDRNFADNYETIKAEFLNHSGISGVTASSAVPGQDLGVFTTLLIGQPDDRRQVLKYMYFDPDFIPDYNIKILAGRSFDSELQSDQAGGFLINRATMESFGWSSPEEAVGTIMQTGYGSRNASILGVTENFHFLGLQNVVEPLIMEWLPEQFSQVTITVNTSDLDAVLAFSEDTWKRLYPAQPFRYMFLDRFFEQQYRSDVRTARLFSTMAALGIFIACIGLFGLSLFATQRRMKEISVRRVLGSTESGIVYLLTRQFLGWVLLANAIAWPIAYFAIDRWLGSYAYHIDPNLVTFAGATLAVLLIAAFTVSLQSIRAARTNPVDILKSD